MKTTGGTHQNWLLDNTDSKALLSQIGIEVAVEIKT